MCFRILLEHRWRETATSPLDEWLSHHLSDGAQNPAYDLAEVFLFLCP